jgi:hypothetical protein
MRGEPRQTLYLSTRRFCSDNRSQLCVPRVIRAVPDTGCQALCNGAKEQAGRLLRHLDLFRAP